MRFNVDLARRSVEIPTSSQFKTNRKYLKNAQLASVVKNSSGYSWKKLKDPDNMMWLHCKDASANMMWAFIWLPLGTPDRSQFMKWETHLLARGFMGLYGSSNSEFITLPVNAKFENIKVLRFQSTGIGFHDKIDYSNDEKYETKNSFLKIFTKKFLSDITYLRYKKFNRKLDKWYLSFKDYNYYDKDTLNKVATKFPETDTIIYGYNSNSTSAYKSNGTDQGKEYGSMRKSLAENFFGTHYPIETWDIDHDAVLAFIKTQLGITEDATLEESSILEVEIETDSEYYKRILLHTLYPDYDINSDTIEVDGVTYTLDFENNLFIYTEEGETKTTSIINYTIKDVEYYIFLSIANLSCHFTEEELLKNIEAYIYKYNYKFLDMEYTSTHLNNIEGVTNDSRIDLVYPTKTTNGYDFTYREISERYIFTDGDGGGSDGQGGFSTSTESVSVNLLQSIWKGKTAIFWSGTTDDEAFDSDSANENEESPDFVEEEEDQEYYIDHINNIFDYPSIDSRETLDSILAETKLNVQIAPLIYNIDSSGNIVTQAILFHKRLKSTYQYYVGNTQTLDTEEKWLNIEFETEANTNKFKSTTYNFGIPLQKRSYKINNYQLYQSLLEELDSTRSTYYIYKIKTKNKTYYYPIKKSVVDSTYSINYQVQLIPVLPNVPFQFLIWQALTRTAKTLQFLIIIPKTTNCFAYYRSSQPLNFFNHYNVHVRSYFKNLGLMVKEWDRIENPDYKDTTNNINNTKKVSKIYKDPDNPNYSPRLLGSRKGLVYNEKYDDRNKDVEESSSEYSWLGFKGERFTSYFDSEKGKDAYGQTNRGICYSAITTFFTFAWYLNDIVRSVRTLRKLPAKYCDYIAQYYEITAGYITHKFYLPTRFPCSALVTKLKIKKEFSEEKITKNKVEFDNSSGEMSIFSKYTNYKYTIDFNTYCKNWKDLITLSNKIYFVNLVYPAFSQSGLKNYYNNHKDNINIETDILPNIDDYGIVFVPYAKKITGDLSNYGWIKYSELFVIPNKGQEQYPFYLYYRPEIKPYFEKYFVKKNLTFKLMFYISSYSNRSYTYVDYTSKIKSKITFSSLSAQELVDLYYEYIDSSVELNIEAIESSVTEEDFQVEDTYQNLQNSLNTDTSATYMDMLAPCYFNIDKNKPIYLEDCSLNKWIDHQYDNNSIIYPTWTIPYPRRLQYPNDHEIRITKQSALLQNMTESKNYTLDISKICKLKEVVLNSKLSNEEILEDWTKYLQNRSNEKETEIIQLINDYVEMICSLEEDYENRDSALFTLNQMLYANKILEGGTLTSSQQSDYKKFILSQLYSEDIQEILDANKRTLSRSVIESALADYIIETYFEQGSVLYNKDGLFEEKWYKFFSGYSSYAYYTYFSNIGVYVKLKDNWIGVRVDSQDLSAIISESMDIATLPEDLNGSVTYSQHCLPMFEKVWSKCSYYEKKFIQHCAMVTEIISTQPVSSPQWNNIISNAVMSYITIVAIVVISIVFTIFGQVEVWALVILIIVSVLSTIALILMLIMAIIGTDSPAYKFLNKLLNIVNIAITILNVVLVFMAPMSIMQIITICMKVVDVIVNLSLQSLTKSAEQELEEVEAELTALEEEKEAYEDANPKTIADYTSLHTYSGIFKTSNYYDACSLSSMIDSMVEVDATSMYDYATSSDMDYYV